MTENFPTFRGLLRGAICNRTQAQFALESGISAEHLNRMLNATTIHRPTKQTLMKIANVAKNGVTFQLLKNALDADEGRPTDDMKCPEERLAEAQEEFRPEFKNAAEHTMNDLAKTLESQTYPVTVKCLADFMDTVTKQVKEISNDNLSISYEIYKTHPYTNDLHKYAKSWATVKLSMAGDGRTAESEMILYFTELPMDGDNDCVIIQNASCAVIDIEDLWGTPNAAIDAHEDDEDMLEKALQDPYYIQFDDITKFVDIKPDAAKQLTKEEQLLRAIFGTGQSYSETIYGFGFWFEEIPNNMLSFLKKHIESILSITETPYEIAKAVREALEKAVEANNIEIVLDAMGQNEMSGTADGNYLDWCGRLISFAMEAETTFPFMYLENTAECKEFTNMSEKSCILIDRSDVNRNHIARETLLLTVAMYARELGVRKIGDIIFTHKCEMHCTPRTYTIKLGNKPTDEDAAPAKLLKDMNYAATFVPKTAEPKCSGRYAVKLKDGRCTVCIWMAKQKIWLAKHKEWSHMIEAYDPEPIVNLEHLDTPDSPNK